jgi:YjbE family integral membrane protein
LKILDLDRRFSDHLDRYSSFRRQRRRYCARLPQASAPPAHVGHRPRTLVAISLRVIFTGMVTQLMTMPYVKLVGGVLLFWIAVKLLGGEESERDRSVDSLWKAIKIVAIADVVMSLDNIIAVAAAARGSYALLMFGLAVSIPLIMAGAAIVIALLERFPVIVWAGAALLGWIAGEIIAGDPLFTQHLDQATAHSVQLGAAMAGALLVLLIGVVRRRLSRRSAPDQA